MPVLKKISALTCIAVIGLTAASCTKDQKSAQSMMPKEATVEFDSVKIPKTDSEKRAVLASDWIKVNGEKYEIGFNTILRSGEKPGENSEPFGTVYDKEGNVIKSKDGSAFVSNSNDFSSLIQGEDGGLYMVSHFEESPAVIYITELNQASDGKLTPVRTRHIDYADVNGGWVHCAGSVTPWGTHLGSEEYEPDARKVDKITGGFNDNYDQNQARYFGLDPEGKGKDYFDNMNVYDYGWQLEIKVNSFDKVEVAKHYTMGRVAHELGKVMPDGKTVYISDDGTNVGLFRFVADEEGDLSSGTLYVAKWKQTKYWNGGAADIDWINLGHARNSEIKTYLDKKVGFYDIFEAETPYKDQCPSEGFTIINTTTGQECLKVRPGMEKAASRLETRRYAAMKGGTTEFRKMEGITIDKSTNTLYLAMSELARGMEDNKKNGKSTDKYDAGGPNDIQVPFNRCGAVYALDMDGAYTAYNMYAVVEGRPVTKDYGATNEFNKYDENGPLAKNKCSLESISNPDNITFMDGYNTLIIGEDTGGGHQNDMIWSFNLSSKKLTRIQTTPYGSETTSPYFYPNINGWAYLMSVIQHPYGESDTDKAEPGSEATKGYTGYVGPFPAR